MSAVAAIKLVRIKKLKFATRRGRPDISNWLNAGTHIHIRPTPLLLYPPILLVFSFFFAVVVIHIARFIQLFRSQSAISRLILGNNVVVQLDFQSDCVPKLHCYCCLHSALMGNKQISSLLRKRVRGRGRDIARGKERNESMGRSYGAEQWQGTE